MDAFSRERPLPAGLPVVTGRDAYLDENGFTIEAYEASKTPASFLGIDFSVPNTPRHRWAIKLHDLHHVATGFGTDPAGEGEISAWELRRGGMRELGPYVGGLVLIGVAMGLAFAPRRTLRAFRAATPGVSLFNDREHSYDELLGLSVGELRTLLGIPSDGLAATPRGLHTAAPGR
jgi:hypothetical protein